MARDDVLRIANCSAYYGDRLEAAREVLEGGPVDVLTGDYLAELTMLLLARAREHDPQAGYAATFLRQMRMVLATALERGVKVVSNAGGLNPRGLATALRGLCDDLGVDARIAWLEDDDLLARLPELQAAGHELRHLDSGEPLGERAEDALTANAYTGAWGIARALEAGADVVICGRVSDASLVVGPAAWRFGWARDDWDRLAGAVVAGHIIECGTQTTGGNYSFYQELDASKPPGFPIAEVAADGSAVITKHPGTGGRVSVDTVTSQLLYELGAPGYLNPDVVARFDTLHLEPLGPDRVRVSGVRSEPAPATLKVGINLSAGFANTMTLALTGLDIETKAEVVRRRLLDSLGGPDRFERFETQLLRLDRTDPPSPEEATGLLRVTVVHRNPHRVGRKFTQRVVELYLTSVPGFYLTTPPAKARPLAAFWPTTLPAGAVRQAVLLDGEPLPDEPSAGTVVAAEPFEASAPAPAPLAADGETRRVPLGRVFGAVSGDKGGNANVGVWARSDDAWAWLFHELTEDRFRALVLADQPEREELEVRRYALPNLRALNFVVVGYLGQGVGAGTALDPQAKGLGEFLRARLVELPRELIG